MNSGQSRLKGIADVSGLVTQKIRKLRTAKFEQSMHQKNRGSRTEREGKEKESGGEEEREEERWAEIEKAEKFLVAFWSFYLAQLHLFLVLGTSPVPL